MTAFATNRKQVTTPWIRAIAVILVLAVAMTGMLPASQAEAQQRPRTIVDMIFGGGSGAEQPRRTIKKRVIRKRKAATPQKRSVTRKKRSADQQKRSSSRNTARSAPASAAPAAVTSDTTDKRDNAKKILVVGDFMGASLADGLEEAFADDEMVVVTSKTNGSSGLVRDDFYDWGKNLGPLIDETKPDVLAVMIGANDRQPIRVSGATLAVRSDGWTAEYEKRATDLAKIAEEKNVPLIWVGMPSFKYDSMSEDMVYFNDIYRRAAERVSGEFVSIWDGFVDKNGDFIYSGPDVNGQTARLRGSDGLSMTDAGDEKLAFFTEKALLPILGNAAAHIALGEESLPTIQLQPLSNAASAQVAAPVGLSDPGLDGSESLLGTGSGQTAFSLEMSPRDRLVLNGDQLRSQEGRADNFAWNTKSGAIRSDPPVVYRGSIDLKTLNESSGIEPPKEMPTILDAIIEDWQNGGSSDGDSDAETGLASPD
ncbi:SGNH family hydrolase [Fulvimarina sp. MAC3]|uniref:SGNH/GDSL hydrolase family protein n=1 Tax=Fulvimarina sp. MAC3 TaxID=3148887 RepID=UPI0031FD1F34